MHLTQFFERPVVGEQQEVPTPQVRVEMIHGPDRGLHLQQERRVVALVLLQASAGVCHCVMSALFVDLGEDGSEAARLISDSEAGICNESILPIPARVGHDRF